MPTRNYASLTRLRLAAARERSRDSLFVLPALIVVAGIAVAEATNYLDRHVANQHIPSALLIPRDAAITLLGTVAGATITTAGVVFSIMVVSVQLASGQFSPRVVRGFFRDRLAQSVIGILVAAFAYAVITLQQMHEQGSGGGSSGDVPVISVDLTALAALVGVFSIVAFLDRSAHGLYVGKVAVRVAKEAVETLHRLPESRPPATAREVTDDDLDRLGPPFVVRSAADGWVQQMSGSAVLSAVPAGSVVRLETRVGAYLAEGQTLATVWPQPPEQARDAVTVQIRDAVVIGERRTMQQDVDFGLRQLVDIALRALSPAVNDPTTAIEAMLRVSSVLRRVLVDDLPPQVSGDASGSVLLTPWDLDHAEYVRHAYDQVRLAAATQPAVLIALLRNLRMLVATVESAGVPERAAPLRLQIRLIVAGAERAGLLPEDFAAVRAAADPGLSPSGGKSPRSTAEAPRRPAAR